MLVITAYELPRKARTAYRRRHSAGSGTRLRRASAHEQLSEDALHELADELFRGYDADEAAHAAAQSR